MTKEMMGEYLILKFNNPHFEQLPYNLPKYCFDMINSVEKKPGSKKAEKILEIKIKHNINYRQIQILEKIGS